MRHLDYGSINTSVIQIPSSIQAPFVNASGCDNSIHATCRLYLKLQHILKSKDNIETIVSARY
jgi:hypothetical protein